LTACATTATKTKEKPGKKEKESLWGQAGREGKARLQVIPMEKN